MQELLSQQAAEWIAEERHMLMGQPRRRGLLQWLRGSRSHVNAYLRMAVIEEDLVDAMKSIDTPLEELLAAARQDDAPVVLQPAPVLHRQAVPARSANGVRRAWMVAACAALVVTVGVFGLQSSTEPTVYRTAQGEQRTLQLEDGTRLQLNVGTEVRVAYGGKARDIELVHGQAFFDVAKDPRPLQVRIGQNVVRDIGTAFDIYRRGKLDTVSLVHGKVELWRQPAPGPHWWSRGSDKPASRIAELAPGMRLSIDAQGQVREDLASGAEGASAWTHNQIAFDDTPMEQVAAEFNRYNTVQLRIDDPRLASMRISGMFSSRDLDSFVLYLRSMPQTRVEQRPGQIVVVAENKLK
ncbi:FecR family protein [Pseudoxanthomonas sp. GM95]|uniref:FecR family protein n=1 Tax=Pseudoxanthomonas sp. GM95 TaxID=1881043 RepID=UPI0008C19C2B|nr:FecR domain-containing protein [Pseudoxanthomonas sp. GM95]SEL18698.1 FecR family protein [Pseudoxanthomonas sp. GM95]